MPRPAKSLKDMEAELGGVGTDITITFKFSGLVDFGKEVQLMTPDGLFFYLPTETVMKVRQ